MTRRWYWAFDTATAACCGAFLGTGTGLLSLHYELSPAALVLLVAASVAATASSLLSRAYADHPPKDF